MRWRQHCNATEPNRAVSAAIRKHTPQAVRREVVSTHDTREEAMAAEIALIAKLNTIAPNGYNLTSGGEGVIGAPPHVWKAAGEAYARRFREDPEMRARVRAGFKISGPKISERLRAWWATPAAAQLRAKRSSPEVREALRIRNLNRTPETSAKMGAGMKRNWQDPEYRAKVNAAREAKQAELRKDPEWVAAKKAKMAEAMRKKWQDPEYVAKRAAAQADPDTRARMLEGSRKKKTYTPEAAAARAEKIRQKRLENWKDPAYRERMRLSRESKKQSSAKSTTSK